MGKYRKNFLKKFLLSFVFVYVKRELSIKFIKIGQFLLVFGVEWDGNQTVVVEIRCSLTTIDLKNNENFSTTNAEIRTNAGNAARAC